MPIARRDESRFVAARITRSELAHLLQSHLTEATAAPCPFDEEKTQVFAKNRPTDWQHIETERRMAARRAARG